MKRCFTIFLAGVVLALTVPATTQAQTLAHLSRETAPDIPRSNGTVWNGPRVDRSVHSAALPESALSRAAARALFVSSKVERARLLATQALRHDPRDAEALFVRMEVAGMEANDEAMLDAAARLCEIGADAPGDLRIRLAAVRLRESAANTPEFRKAIPRIQRLLANAQEPWPDLHAALLKAAMDGAPGLDPYAIARASSILTDWRIVGPLGRHALLDFDKQQISSSDDLAQPSYQNRLVENFQFPDGEIVLPAYLSHWGIFYAAARFASLTAGSWTTNVEGAGPMEVYVDGRLVSRSDAGREHHSAVFDAAPGPHRVLVKFASSATPLRISFARTPDQDSVPPPNRTSLQELTYLLAAGHYAAGDFRMAIRQIAAVPLARSSAALQFLLAQAWSAVSPTASECATAWYTLRELDPGAVSAEVALGRIALSQGDSQSAIKFASRVLAAQPSNTEALETITEATKEEAAAELMQKEESWWALRLAEYPSCEALQNAIGFYRARGKITEARSAQRRLSGCAPESLDYAQSLSSDGNYAAAARALQLLLAAAPLNRAARLMLVRELQLSGDDDAAQRAAVKWLHVAPNAENYHRLATASVESEDPAAEQQPFPTAEFYAPYRRDAAAVARAIASQKAIENAVVLLDDHVAIARPDGSVSLYVHTARRVPASQEVDLTLPQQAQVITARILSSDGTATTINTQSQARILAAGDTIDEEYVLHYSGDGGIPEHAEVFQFVFGSFDQQVANARFVVLTPAIRADRGVVIATGDAPRLKSRVRNGMLERIWEKETESVTNGEALAGPNNAPAIIRLVEQENGWSVPSKAEHQRRIETIHPGPRPEDS